ncbi:MAG: DegT/DnrJ/EryC1/StrS family aminotransferase [Candidatus Woesearchaeota archaeon]
MEVSILDLKKQYHDLKDEIDSEISKVLESGYFILGKEEKKFEAKIKDYLDTDNDCIGVASGSDALLLSLMAIDISPGDEVITTPFTFFATAGAISRLGAKPVFVDIGDDYNIDVDKISEKINENTKAIITVDLFGNPSDLKRLRKICDDNDLYLIDDACQAIGSEIDGKKIGNFAHFTCFSFFPTKNLGAYGDGGLVVVEGDEMSEKIRMLRKHGSKKKYHHEFVGINSRLDEMQAAILNVKLDYLDEWIDKRQKNAKIYSDNLKEIINVPKIDDNKKHVFHQYTISVDDRDGLKEYLSDNGIQTAVYYPVPLHLQNCFDNDVSLSNSEYASSHVLSLPIHENLNINEIHYVIDKIKEFYD